MGRAWRMSFMRPKDSYLLLSILGAIVPLVELAPWLATNGLAFPLLLRELFVNRVSSFFALDVILSAGSLFIFISLEQSRLTKRVWWIPVIATLTLGVSAGLPLMLYLRERFRKVPKT